MGEVFAVGELDSRIGRLRIAVTEKGVVRIALPRGGGKGFSGWIARQVPDGERVERLPWLDATVRELEEYSSGTRTEFGVPLDLRGTPFQLSVWQHVFAIPYGETRTYAQVAHAVGSPKGFRAVGAANGANPVPLIVPCHRVIASDGGLGGYGGGLETKRRLLAFEQAAAPGALL